MEGPNGSPTSERSTPERIMQLGLGFWGCAENPHHSTRSSDRFFDTEPRVVKVSTPVSRKPSGGISGRLSCSVPLYTDNSFETHWSVLPFGCCGGEDREDGGKRRKAEDSGE